MLQPACSRALPIKMRCSFAFAWHLSPMEDEAHD
jgi:hypothetical protein